jgi:GT2 family glycosyltransferase
MSVKRQAAPAKATSAQTKRALKTRRALKAGELPVEGSLEAVTSLGARFMLAIVSGAAACGGGALRGWLLIDGATQRLSVSRISPRRGSDGREHALLLLGAAGQTRPLASSGTLVLELDGRAFALERSEIAEADIPPERFGPRLLECLGTVADLTLLEELIPAIARRPGALGDAAQALSLIRDAVRERLPFSDASASVECAAHVEALWRVDRSSFYLEGWVLDRSDRLRSLWLITAEGRRIDVFACAARYSRPDVCEFFRVPPGEKLGFIVYVELPEEGVLDANWLLQGGLMGGAGFEVQLPPIIDDPVNLRATILGDLELEGPEGGALLREHIAPALTRLQERLSTGVRLAAVDQHGPPPAEPQVTIVVPLYRRTDFLEHQLAQFVLDPELRSADLLYVLDSPEDAPALRPFARHLYDLYGVPFRLATLTTNGGYSAVNNLGASLARGRMLLLLNSDVLPSQPGWLSRMVEFYDEHPPIGALAPKLLYEDDSIQHAGLCFERAPGAASWSNEHFYKGLHRAFPAANVARAVPAVTGACLLIETELYRELDGLRGSYVRGDYEDSDLCLRLREHGRECWYMPAVELYHLEGQSYPSPEREAASQYNQWLHTELWRESLAAQESRP